MIVQSQTYCLLFASFWKMPPVMRVCIMIVIGVMQKICQIPKSNNMAVYKMFNIGAYKKMLNNRYIHYTNYITFYLTPPPLTHPYSTYYRVFIYT